MQSLTHSSLTHREVLRHDRLRACGAYITKSIEAGEGSDPLLVLLLLQHVLVHEVLLLEQQLLLLLQSCLLLRHILWGHRQPGLHPSAWAWLAWRLLHATIQCSGQAPSCSPSPVIQGKAGCTAAHRLQARVNFSPCRSATGISGRSAQLAMRSFVLCSHLSSTWVSSGVCRQPREVC